MYCNAYIEARGCTDRLCTYVLYYLCTYVLLVATVDDFKIKTIINQDHIYNVVYTYNSTMHGVHVHCVHKLTAAALILTGNSGSC